MCKNRSEYFIAVLSNPESRKVFRKGLFLSVRCFLFFRPIPFTALLLYDVGRRYELDFKVNIPMGSQLLLLTF